MKYTEPESLPEDTPDWFRGWHESTFWHFKFRIESKLSNHDKLLWIVLAAIVAAAITGRFL